MRGSTSCRVTIVYDTQTDASPLQIGQVFKLAYGQVGTDADM